MAIWKNHWTGLDYLTVKIESSALYITAFWNFLNAITWLIFLISNTDSDVYLTTLVAIMHIATYAVHLSTVI